MTRLERLEQKLVGMSRTRAEPEVESGDGTGTVSKFAGAAWLNTGETWPACKRCKRPMHLLLQLRAEDAPANTVTLPSGSLLQIFHCGTAKCDVGETKRSPGGTGVMMRIVDAKEVPKGKTAKSVPDGAVLACRIVGFSEAEELPGSEDVRHAGIELHAKERRALGERAPASTTKLGGWPDWIQSAERPTCPTCAREMRFVAQLKSEHYIGVGFGDTGLAYVHQCATHPTKLAWAWSST